MKKVTEFELNSLISKFKHLCNAGFEASLLVSSKDGQASVSLKVELGKVFHSPKDSTAGDQNSKQRKKRPPAYFRRQKQRRDARKKEIIKPTEAAAENATAMRNLVVYESSTDDSNAAECKLPLISSVNKEMVSESSTKNIAAETEDVVFAAESEDDEVNGGLKEQLELLIRESQRKRNVWEEMRFNSTTTEENDSFM